MIISLDMFSSLFVIFVLIFGAIGLAYCLVSWVVQLLMRKIRG